LHRFSTARAEPAFFIETLIGVDSYGSARLKVNTSIGLTRRVLLTLALPVLRRLHDWTKLAHK
jgi:hypothetical protein